MDNAVTDLPPAPPSQRLLEVAGACLRLGCHAFGGPIAHLGYLRTGFVDKRRWLDGTHYADLVALCQFLPGPASSQVVFALGMHRAGLPGALIASVCFTLPSALLMVGLAYGLGNAPSRHIDGWLHGLQLAAVAVVAQAVWRMGRQFCTDGPRIVLCLATAVVVLASAGAAEQLATIVLGGLVGWRLYRHKATHPPSACAAAPTLSPTGLYHRGRTHRMATAALLVWLALLLALPPCVAATGWHKLAVFETFYRAGALVYGGGHVVLPLLYDGVVPPGWVTDHAFLAGYGAAQALPGPLFAFAGYLGAAMRDGGWQTALWCLFAIFLPGWLLTAGALPYWQMLRTLRWAQAALAGTQAAVVGLLLAALVRLLAVKGSPQPWDWAIAAAAFVLLERHHAPPWLVVVGCAVWGWWRLGS